MSQLIAYGLILSTEDFLNYIQDFEQVESQEELARKLLKDSGRKLNRELTTQLVEDPARFFLYELNLIYHFEGLDIYPMKKREFVFIGTYEQFNSRWQDSDYFYSFSDIFPLSGQKELRKTLKSYGLPKDQCQVWLGLNPFDIALPLFAKTQN